MRQLPQDWASNCCFTSEATVRRGSSSISLLTGNSLYSWRLWLLGPALLEGFVFEALCHENGSSLSSGVWLSSGYFSWCFAYVSVWALLFWRVLFLRLFAMKMGLRFLLVFGCLLVVFLSVLLMFLFGSFSFRRFCFWDSLPWKWVFSFFWCLAVFWLFFLVFCLCFCLYSFGGFCFWDSLPWKWVFSFFWCLAVFWLFFLVFCFCFCLGPALLEGFVFGTLCHENGSSLSSGCLLVVFLGVLLMFLFGSCSFRGFCFWDSLPWKWVFAFFWLSFGCFS